MLSLALAGFATLTASQHHEPSATATPIIIIGSNTEPSMEDALKPECDICRNRFSDCAMKCLAPNMSFEVENVSVCTFTCKNDLCNTDIGEVWMRLIRDLRPAC